MDIVSDHLDEVPLAGEPSAVIALPLQNPPEALHRAVINAVGNAGHTLRHSGLYKFVVEGTVGILKSSVAVKEILCRCETKDVRPDWLELPCRRF